MVESKKPREQVPLGRKLGKQREEIHRRQPKDADWTEYRPGDNLPLTEKPAPGA